MRFFRDDWITFLALILVILACGMAFRASGADNACSMRGGHIEGMIKMECVVP